MEHCRYLRLFVALFHTFEKGRKNEFTVSFTESLKIEGFPSLQTKHKEAYLHVNLRLYFWRRYR